MEQQRHTEEQLNELKNQHNQFIKESNEQKQKLELQLSELNKNLLQVFNMSYYNYSSSTVELSIFRTDVM